MRYLADACVLETFAVATLAVQGAPGIRMHPNRIFTHVYIRTQNHNHSHAQSQTVACVHTREIAHILSALEGTFVGMPGVEPLVGASVGVRGLDLFVGVIVGDFVLGPLVGATVGAVGACVVCPEHGMPS